VVADQVASSDGRAASKSSVQVTGWWFPCPSWTAWTSARRRIEEAKRSTYRAGERLGLHNRPDARITDGAGDSGLSLHKPGFRISNTITRDRLIYDAYDAAAEVAYKNVGGVESEVGGQREGDTCTVQSGQGLYGPEGSPGHLRMVEGELVCVADSKLSDAMRDEHEAAHQEYQDRIQNAWREGR
jgi:hypothetical protein